MTRPATDVQLVANLLDQGHRQREIADMTGVPQPTLARWMSGDIGAAIASRRALADHDATACSLVDNAPPSEYAYLLGLYLGDGCISTHRRGVFRLQIYCCDSYPGLMTLCHDTMQRVLPASKVGRVGRDGCTEVYSFSKHWPCLFPQHGPGMKHLRPIVLTDWQGQILEAHADQVLRGLIHSDGCRVANRVVTRGRAYEYPRYFFVNQSTDIIGICTRCLDLLGIEWRMNRPNSVSIARRASVAALDRFIGPKT